MKLFYLPAIILLAVSCSNEIAENTDREENILRIGEIDTRSGETSEWVWKTGDKLTVTANGQTAVYTRTAEGKWSCGNASFTKEALGVVATNGVNLSFNKDWIVQNQYIESSYRQADYMTGTGSLDFLTINGNLKHMNTDWVINIIEGDGWNGKFASTMNDEGAEFATRTFLDGYLGYLIKAYHQGSTFRFIIPTRVVVKGQNINLGTLTLGSGTGTPQSLKGKTATITYTFEGDVNSLAGKRLTLSVTLDASLNLTITGITVKDFTGMDVPGELKP
ncbi:hypothetical protein [Parabacteroides sp.]